MDINAITQMIGSMGFPIVACCGMFYLYNNTITTLSITLQKMDKTLDMICDRLNVDKAESKE